MNARFENTAFWIRCACRTRTLLILTLLLLTGVFSGSLLSLFLFRDGAVLPMLFSGIPVPQQGFFSCFAAILLNQLIFLTLTFLFGVTAFGAFAAAVFTVIRGAFVGLGVSSFLWTGGLGEWGISALIYTPAAAASLLLFLLFDVRAAVFSDRLRRAGFASSGETLDFQDYWKDFVLFLSLSVGVSLPGGLLAVLGKVFFL